MSSNRDEILAIGFEESADLVTGLHKDLGALVDKYTGKLKYVSFMSEHEPASREYSADVLQSRVQGYLNVLAAILKPLAHDSAQFDCLLHNTLHRLEGSEYHRKALSVWQRRHSQMAAPSQTTTEK